MRLSDIVSAIGGELDGDGAQAGGREITGLVPLEQARPGTLTFLTNAKWYEIARDAICSGIIAQRPIEGAQSPVILHRNPYWAMAKVAQMFYHRHHQYQGVSELAFVHSTASLHPTVVIYPFAYIGAHATIGKQSVVMPHAFIGDHCVIGEQVEIGPSCAIMEGCRIKNNVLIHGGSVLGADGFGFAPGEDDLLKIPQVGGVEIGEDVEIGANVTIDRATFGATRLHRGVKVDSQVHIAHNAEIGEWSMLCGQAGIAGSAKMGKRCIVAGHAGVSNGIELADGVALGPMSGAVQDIEQAGSYYGMPAIAAATWRRRAAFDRNLPETLQRLRRLERRIAELEARLPSQS